MVDDVEYFVLLLADLFLFFLDLVRLAVSVRYGREELHFALLCLRRLLVQEQISSPARRIGAVRMVQVNDTTVHARHVRLHLLRVLGLNAIADLLRFIASMACQ